MDAVTARKPITADQHSHVVRPAEMEWKQTWVIEGRLLDTEGPATGIEAKAGEFIWREPGTRHVAACPEGGLMLAIFQVPNKFYEKDGRITDQTGRIWDEVWGHTANGR
jgi:quercetin dioxygenase-like cupin family protein